MPFHVESITKAIYRTSHSAALAVRTAYTGWLDFILRVHAPAREYIELIFMGWTVAKALSTMLRYWWQSSRPYGLPESDEQGRSQKQRFKVGILLRWWITVHFVFKPKKDGFMVKFGPSFGLIKVLVVCERSRNSRLSWKRQVKYYGQLRRVKSVIT